MVWLKGTPIHSRQAFALFACLLALGLASCSPKAPKAKTAFDLQQEQSQREKWRMATMAGEYDKVGRKNPKWDEAAKNALESFAGLQLNAGIEQAQDFQRIGQFAAQAVQSGCDDPFIKYLYVMLVFDPGRHTSNEVVNTYLQAASDMSGSGYSEIRKFYANLRPAVALKQYNRRNNDYVALRSEASAHLNQALMEKDMPPREARDACLALLEAVKSSPQQFEPFYRAMEPLLFKNFSGSTTPYIVKGSFYVDYAWQGRGGDTADKVTDTGWKLFGERLKTANEALETAWRMDPSDRTAPNRMMAVMLGAGGDRQQMELWFQRAMRADSNNWDACNSKLYYLYPRWYGSYEEMLAFGRECLTNQAWGGTVTLMLVDAHQAVATDSGENMDYWKHPDVWPEIHAAFEEFFRRNPEAISHRHNYVWYANACGAWKVVNEQVPLLGPINYSYLGGKVAFDDMVRNAREQAGK